MGFEQKLSAYRWESWNYKELIIIFVDFIHM